MKAIAIFMMCFFPILIMAATVNMADRHKDYGADCEACHGVSKPAAGAYVEQSACLGCHGSYEDLQKQTASKFKDYNPHLNHLGEVECSVCHSGHNESISYCNSCHEDLHKMK